MTKNIDINRRKMEQIARRKKKAVLRRIATIGLVAAIAIPTVKAINSTNNVNKDFEYNQNSAISYEEQYKEETGIDITDSDMAIKLAQFDIAYDNFENVKNSNSEVDIVNARIALVTASNDLVDVAQKVLDDKAKDALGLCEEDTAYVYRTTDGDARDIIAYETKIDGAKGVYDKGIPNNMSMVLNGINEMNNYQGTGESVAWGKEINGYSNIAIKLYNNTLDTYSKDYVMDNDKLVIDDNNEVSKTR